MMMRSAFAAVVVFSVGVVGCGQSPDLSVSFDGRDCSMRDRQVADDAFSIELQNNSDEQAWFGIGRIPTGVTLDRMVEAVAASDTKTETVMRFFDPDATVFGEHVPVGGAQVVWGDIRFEPGTYSVWCTSPDSADTAGTFEQR